MSHNLGTVAYDDAPEGQFGYGMGEHHEKHYSEETAKAIDVEVRQILDAAYKTAKEIINQMTPQVQILTDALIEFETLDAEDIEEIVVKKNWNIDIKRERLKQAAELQKKSFSAPPPPPPEPFPA